MNPIPNQPLTWQKRSHWSLNLHQTSLKLQILISRKKQSKVISFLNTLIQAVMKFYRPISKLNRPFISIELICWNDKYINSHIYFSMNNRPNMFGGTQTNSTFGQPQTNNVFGNNNNTGQGNVFGANRSTFLLK